MKVDLEFARFWQKKVQRYENDTKKQKLLTKSLL